MSHHPKHKVHKLPDFKGKINIYLILLVYVHINFIKKQSSFWDEWKTAHKKDKNKEKQDHPESQPQTYLGIKFLRQNSPTNTTDTKNSILELQKLQLWKSVFFPVRFIPILFVSLSIMCSGGGCKHFFFFFRGLLKWWLHPEPKEV